MVQVLSSSMQTAINDHVTDIVQLLFLEPVRKVMSSCISSFNVGSSRSEYMDLPAFETDTLHVPTCPARSSGPSLERAIAASLLFSAASKFRFASFAMFAPSVAAKVAYRPP
ncbi:MAG TPA: hypothetical protein PKH36_16535, partial [Flavobacteriales bacterium]|nr:hypothetical protein [Flavobacteriales bacterium]